MTLPLLSDRVLDALLEDDAPFGDLTTYVLGFGAERGRIAFSARDRMVLACAEEAARLFERAGAHATALSASGVALDPGAPILAATGSAAALHRAWKVAQTLVEYASGVATLTRRIVEAARVARPDRGRLHAQKHAGRKSAFDKVDPRRRRDAAPAWAVGDDLDLRRAPSLSRPEISEGDRRTRPTRRRGKEDRGRSILSRRGARLRKGRGRRDPKREIFGRERV